jgi:uncharacterized RDD family membrane protein YckC
MQTIQIRTTQNVFIHYPLASIGDRIIAHILDNIILIAYSLAVGVALYNLNVEAVWLYLILIGVPFMFYSVFFEILMNGQTPAKRALNIKVIRLDGTEPSIGDYVLRWIFRFVDFHMMSGVVALLVIAVGGKGQRLGDVVAGTCVVKIVGQREITAEQIFTTTTDTYQPTFQNVIELSSKDIEIIQQAIAVGKSGNLEPADLVTTRIKSMLNIQSDLPSLVFLETIVKDFNHLTSRS